MIRLICGTWTGVLIHRAHAELLCPACVVADREHSRRRVPPARDLPVRENIHRCRCGAWLADGRACSVCEVLSAGAA